MAKYQSVVQNLEKINNEKNNYNDEIDSLEKLLDANKLALQEFNSKFVEKFTYYVKVARAMGRIVPIIYFSILLTFTVGSGALLITYACKKRNQQFFIIPMHIAWNGIRYFIFTFFMYGCSFGMLFLGARDAIAYLRIGFGQVRLDDIPENNIIPESSKDYFNFCLFDEEPNFSHKISQNRRDNLDELIKNYISLSNWYLENEKKEDFGPGYSNIAAEVEEMKSYVKGIISSFSSANETIFEFQKIISASGSIYGNSNCKFIKNNLNLLYNAMWDFSWETRILCALSCCIAFFGAIAVYFFLFVMHFYKRDEYTGYKKEKLLKDKPIKSIKKREIKNKIAPPKEIQIQSSEQSQKKKIESYNNDNDSSGS